MVNGWLMIILPRDSGEGGPPKRAVEGAQDSTRRKQFKEISATRSIVLQRQRNVESSAPSTTVRSLRELQWSPSPASRGRKGKRSRSRNAPAPEVCQPKPRILIASKKMKGGGAPVGATVPWGLATQRMLPSICASGAAARPAGRARLSALHRGACRGHLPKLDPGRASRDAVRRRYPHLGTALKRSTSRAGRNAGGVDARTARERQ